MFKKWFFALCLLCPAAANAETVKFDIAYDVRILGMRIGSAAIEGQLQKGSYHIQGNGKISGLINMVVSGHGDAAADGTITPASLSPSMYHIFNTAGKKTNLIDMKLKNNAVAALTVEPPTPDNPDRIALEPSHKRGIIDPLSAFIMPRTVTGALSASECQRNIEIFDGRQRYTIALSPKSIQTLPQGVNGFSGEVLVCEAQYTPIAGHRPAKKVMRYLTDARDHEIWLAPTADMKVLVPIRLQLRTIIGPLIIEASHYNSTQ